MKINIKKLIKEEINKLFEAKPSISTFFKQLKNTFEHDTSVEKIFIKKLNGNNYFIIKRIDADDEDLYYTAATVKNNLFICGSYDSKTNKFIEDDSFKDMDDAIDYLEETFYL